MGSQSPPPCSSPFPSLLQSPALSLLPFSPPGDFQCLSLSPSFWIPLSARVAPRPMRGWLLLQIHGWWLRPARGEKGVRRWHHFIEQRKAQNRSFRVPRKLSPLPQEPQPGESASRSLSSPPPHPRLSPFCFLIPKRRKNKLTHLLSALTSLPLPGFGRAAELFTCHSEWSSSSTLLHRTRITILIKKHL